MPTTPLTFEQAVARLKSTMPRAEYYEFEKQGNVDQYGLPTGMQAVAVTCFEPRLTTAVRNIGGWTFLIDNRFLSHTVHKVAMTWFIHNGGLKYGEQELLKSLRYCFKRFYAECLVALAEPPLGRALLWESVIFERQYSNELYLFPFQSTNKEASRFNGRSYKFATLAIQLTQRHELGHYLLSVPGEDILSNAGKLFDGQAMPRIQELMDEGNVRLAEEVFCDAFALNSMIRTEADYEAVEAGFAYSFLHLDEVKSAYFCYLILMQLSKIYFRAQQDARAGWDGAENKTARPAYVITPLQEQIEERSRSIARIIYQYTGSKKASIHKRDNDLYFNPHYDYLLSKAAANLELLNDADELSVTSEADREMARFLSTTMWLPKANSYYFIYVALHRELNGWMRQEEPEEATQAPASDEGAADSDSEEKMDIYFYSHYEKQLQEIFDSYLDVFDAIVADIIHNGKAAAGTSERLEAFKNDLMAKIEAVSIQDENHQAILIKQCLACKKKIMELHLLVLTLMRRALAPNENMHFDSSIQERLSFLEEYAIRHQGKNVAAFTSILIPELKSGS